MDSSARCAVSMGNDAPDTPNFCDARAVTCNCDAPCRPVKPRTRSGLSHGPLGGDAARTARQHQRPAGPRTRCLMTRLISHGTRADWLADKVLRGLIGTALALPYEKRVPMMGSALRRAIGPLLGYRQRAEANLAFIYPDMPAADRRALAEACCDNFGRTLIENYAWAEFGARVADTRPTGGGLVPLAEAAKDRRPVIFVTAHFGNHEAPRQVLTHMGHTIGGLYRPMQNPFFNAHYAKTMTSWGGPVFEQGRRGTMGFARHLKSGGMGTLLFDVAASGIALPFLGKPAHTATSAADIALKLDALVIPYFGIRQADGMSFAVEIEDPVPHGPPATMMADMTARLEAQIARSPAQWFWVHRRWKPRKTS